MSSTPDPVIVRAPVERRQEPRRAEEQRLHLARELVIAKACAVADSYESEPGLDIHSVEHLVELVALLRTAEGGITKAPQIGQGCPSLIADGRQDRCGQFAFPQRCTPGGTSCSMPDAP